MKNRRALVYGCYGVGKTSCVGLEIFSSEALKAIYEFSKGIRKQFLRLAENALDTAAIKGSGEICIEHVIEAIRQSEDQIAGNLKIGEHKVLQALVALGTRSPSDNDFQKKVGLSRTPLTKILSKLAEDNYVIRKKQGNRILYSVSSLYLPYFEKAKHSQ